MKTVKLKPVTFFAVRREVDYFLPELQSGEQKNPVFSDVDLRILRRMRWMLFRALGVFVRPNNSS